MREFDIFLFALPDISNGARDDARIKIEHLPETSGIANGRTVVYFPGIDGDDITRTSFHRAAAACRFLSAVMDQADSELIMGVAGKVPARSGYDRLHAGDAAFQYLKFVWSPCQHPIHPIRLPDISF